MRVDVFQMNNFKDWFKENIKWPLERMWEWPGDRLREFKWFIQRGRRGYADSDLWSLDYYLSDWMPKALRQLKKHHTGYPGWKEANTDAKWKAILEKMAIGFEASSKQKDALLLPTSKRYKKFQKQIDEGFDLFAKWYGSLWD